MDTPLASVIVPSRDRAAVLRDCLASLTRQTLEPGRFEVIVVDNGSRDDTAAVARSFDGALRLQLLHEPEPGLHVGRHAGAKAARSELLMFCDDDIVAEPGWVAAVVAVFAMDQAVAMVGGNNRPGWDGEPAAWLAHAWAQGVGPVPGSHALAALSVLEAGAGRFDIDPRWVWGCNFNLRRAVLDAAGGFHPDGVPNQRLRWRGDGEMHVGDVVRARGARCVFDGAASVTHRVDAGRMTPAYFAKRGRMQGISDSYTAIRRAGRVPPDAGRWRRALADGLRNWRDLARSSWPAPSSAVLQWQAVQAATRRAWREGWDFHRAEVARDPELLAWVLREDYR